MARTGGFETTDAVSVAKEVLADVELILGPLQATPPVVTNFQGVLVSTIHAKLQEIHDAGQQFDIGIKQLAGDAIEPEYSDILEKYANSVTIDGAKLALNQISRHIAWLYRQREAGLSGMIKDLVALTKNASITD